MSLCKVLVGSIVASLLIVLLYGCASAENPRPLSRSAVTKPIIPAPTRDINSPTGYYIPVNIPDAHRELDKALSNDAKQYIKKLSLDEIGAYQNIRLLQVWMMDTWGLDPKVNSRLWRYFIQQGITDQLLMSGILMYSYRDHLAGVKYEYIPSEILTRIKQEGEK